ncbi:hypothetical protein [Leptospira brenneri]|uniref:hypothetical protein n=1 Tax=Leptospira brenneri TaxID=2023182 RepID=UPI000C2A57D5|nr:hypothetical protein [Leptospira brenneri]PJZ43640.1 hypothetical protein CH361_19405 [Leptospira brenneri]
MFNPFKIKQNSYKVRIFIRNEHRRYTPWIIFFTLTFAIFIKSIIPFLIYTILPLLVKKMFSYEILNHSKAILAISDENIFINHKNMNLPVKELSFNLNEIQSIYFDDFFWYSTIGLLMKNKSLVTLNFSTGLNNQFKDSKIYLNSIANQNNIRIISGPDKICIYLITLSILIFLASLYVV